MNGFFELAQNIKEPLLLFLLIVLGMFGGIIVFLLRFLKNHIEYERELLGELSENSKTLVRLTTLIETLVHGKGGSR